MKLVTLTAVMALTATASFGKEVKAQVQDVFTRVSESVPYTDNECVNVEVPVYGNRNTQGDAASGALSGMIIGGLIGKGVGGNDKGAAAGAVLGGLIGADRAARPRTERVVTGYRTERQCTEVTRYRSVDRTVYDYSVATFRIDGELYEVMFVK